MASFQAGAPLCKLSLHGTTYECDFKRMVQKNLTSGKERKIRPPSGLKLPASEPTSKASPGGVANVTVPASRVSNLGNGKNEKIAAVVVPEGGIASVTVPSKRSNNAGNGNDEKPAEVVPQGSPHIQGIVVDGSKKKSWTAKQKAAAGAAAGMLGAAAVGGAIAGAHAAGRDGGDGDAPSGPDHCHDGFYYDHCHDGSYYVPPGCDGSYYAPPDCDGSYYVPPVCDGSYYVPPPTCDYTPGVVDYGCEPLPVPPPVESACGVPGEDEADLWEPCGDDTAGFYEGDADGFDDAADFDAESGEAVADLITCVF